MAEYGKPTPKDQLVDAQRERILKAGKPITVGSAAKALSGITGAIIFVFAGLAGAIMLFVFPPVGVVLILLALGAALAK